MTRIDRIAAENLDRAQFESRYLRRGLPVVIEQLVAGSPAIDKWTTEFWRGDFADRAFPIMMTDRKYFDNIDEPHLVAMKISDYLDALSAEGYADSNVKYYLSNISLDDQFAELCDDIKPITLFPANELLMRILLLGRDSEAQCHYHSMVQAVLVQIRGRKRVEMFAPEQTRYLYPYSLRNARFNFSRVNMGAPDAARHPKFRQAKAISALLEPGDALFIPIHWWHYVRGIDFSTSVTYFYKAQRRDWALNRPAVSSLVRMIYHKCRPSDRSHYSTYRKSS